MKEHKMKRIKNSGLIYDGIWGTYFVFFQYIELEIIEDRKFRQREKDHDVIGRELYQKYPITERLTFLVFPIASADLPLI